MSGFKFVNPGRTANFGSSEHLTQVQHKGTHVDIVDHFDKGSKPVDVHVVHRVNHNGKIDFSIK